MSTRRVTALGASLACSVRRTKIAPVRGERMAIVGRFAVADLARA
jgi:hypothetical protein